MIRRPIRGGYVSQRFGENPNHLAYGYGPKGHQGTDFGGCAGKPVLASHDGTATVHWDANGYGQWVKIINGDIETRYAHIVKQSGISGEVKAGDQIGVVGCTGNCFGAHLHWELWLNGVRVDGEKYIDVPLGRTS